MAAGVSDHVRSLEDMAELADGRLKLTHYPPPWACADDPDEKGRLAAALSFSPGQPSATWLLRPPLR
jgi:hypothetical protein